MGSGRIHVCAGQYHQPEGWSEFYGLTVPRGASIFPILSGKVPLRHAAPVRGMTFTEV